VIFDPGCTQDRLPFSIVYQLNRDLFVKSLSKLSLDGSSSRAVVTSGLFVISLGVARITGFRNIRLPKTELVGQFCPQ
jgi:hypothetical protein